jgi:hypothetical protein
VSKLIVPGSRRRLPQDLTSEQHAIVTWARGPKMYGRRITSLVLGPTSCCFDVDFRSA